ncbi:MAG: hypothetical protein H6559_02885 [Lewinellaceae bacterium]|nr:hypothetical protein [Lewinellaceae bacterium]
MSQENQNKEEWIDAYVWDDMAPEERKAFEEQLAADAGLREEYELRRAIREGYRMERLRMEAREGINVARRQVRAREWANRGLLLLIFLLGIGLGLGLKTLYDWWNPEAPQKEIPQADVIEFNEDEEMLIGQSNDFGFKVAVDRIEIQENKLSGFSSVDSLVVALVTSPSEDIVYADNTVALYFPESQMPDKDDIRLLELILNGERVLYLGIGKKLHVLKKGN